jgi:hypothetical protein
MSYNRLLIHPYNLTKENVKWLTPKEIQEGTIKYLPRPEQIPTEFWLRNEYTRMVEDIIDAHTSRKNSVRRMIAIHRLTNRSIGISNFNTAPEIVNFIIAHLIEAKGPEIVYGHRVAGVALMLSKLITIQSTPSKERKNEAAKHDGTPRRTTRTRSGKGQAVGRGG